MVYKNSSTESTLMQLTKEVHKLQHAQIGQLLRLQKSLCVELIGLYRMRFILSESNNELLVDLTKSIINFIYGPIKAALKTNTITQQKVSYFQYFFKKYSSQLNDPYLFKHNTQKERELQLRYQRDINLMLVQFQINKLPPPSELGQANFPAYEWFHVYPDKSRGEEIFWINRDVAENDQLVVAKYLCALLNSRKGAVFIGLNSFKQIEGVQASDQYFIKLKQRLHEIRKMHIFPAPQENQVFQILCSRIETKFGLKSAYNNNDNIFKEPQVLIKIYANTERVGKAYFIIQKDSKNNLYKFYQDPKIDTLNQKYYSNILQKHQQKCRIPSPIIARYPNTHQIQQKQGAVLSATEEKKLPELKLPPKIYSQHSILVLANKGEEAFRKLLKAINKQQEFFRWMELFDFLPHNSHRVIYYLTHRIKTQDLIKIATEIDPDKRHIIIMKIKPQLTLLRQSLFYKSYQKLKDRYYHFFHKKLVIKRKKSEENNNEYEYFYCFQHELEAIFCFTFLEYGNIRTNFANLGKMKGAVIITQEQIQAING